MSTHAPPNSDAFTNAQRILDTHIINHRGNCAVCGTPGPCPQREPAVTIFSRMTRRQIPPQQ